MRRLDERNKSMFSDRNAVSVVVVLFRHLVIALCSILFFQDPCTSSTKRGHTEVVKCAPPRTFMFFWGAVHCLCRWACAEIHPSYATDEVVGR